MIEYLQRDHRWPYSLFGETSWPNYQLICGSCNAAKSNRLDSDVRRLLGSGAFRSQVVAYLQKHVEQGTIASDVILKSILSCPP